MGEEINNLSEKELFKIIYKEIIEIKRNEKIIELSSCVDKIKENIKEITEVLKEQDKKIQKVENKLSQHDNKLEKSETIKLKALNEYDRIILNNLESRISILEEATEKYTIN